jgi:hypothetical protein
MSNRNTTMLGLAAILTAAGGILSAMFDGDPSTLPDFAAGAAAVIAGIGLIFAKDAKKGDA